jgi:hypothetical protein
MTLNNKQNAECTVRRVTVKMSIIAYFLPHPATLNNNMEQYCYRVRSHANFSLRVTTI